LLQLFPRFQLRELLLLLEQELQALQRALLASIGMKWVAVLASAPLTPAAVERAVTAALILVAELQRLRKLLSSIRRRLTSHPFTRLRRFSLRLLL
jgi:hypothetical protein